jgi:hypothetical protein
MTTAKQAAANRLNAQNSTGPKTAAGRQASAANALKHGLAAEKYLTSDEDPAAFEAFYAALRALHGPEEDVVVDGLVFKIAMLHWRLDRGLRAEAELLDHNSLASLLAGRPEPVQTLSQYEAMNRKTLKQLEETLARHKALRKEMNSMNQRTTTPSPHRGGDDNDTKLVQTA